VLTYLGSEISSILTLDWSSLLREVVCDSGNARSGSDMGVCSEVLVRGHILSLAEHRTGLEGDV
jgi:hypothetical protein